MDRTKWTPRSGGQELAGCVWLGRLIDKARRHIALGAARGDLLGEYMFGNNDYCDAQLLRFLGLKDTAVCELIRDEPDDEKAAVRILDAARKTSADCKRFNRIFLLLNAPILPMLDVDEGRGKSGPGATLLKTFYDTVIVGPATLVYRLAGASSARSEAGDDGPDKAKRRQ